MNPGINSRHAVQQSSVRSAMFIVGRRSGDQAPLGAAWPDCNSTANQMTLLTELERRVGYGLSCLEEVVE